MAMSAKRRRVAPGKNPDVNMISLSRSPYSTMMDERARDVDFEDALVIARSSRVPIRGDEAERDYEGREGSPCSVSGGVHL